MIKNDFQKILSKRKRLSKNDGDNIGDLREIVDSMLVCPQETILFLHKATREEFVLALEGITAFAYQYPQQKIVDICKAKVIQYSNLQKYCRINIAQTIKEIEEYINISSQKQKTLKEEFREILVARERGRQEDMISYTIAHGYDHESIRKLLCCDYRETISFLSNADKDEIATAIEILDDLVRSFEKEQAQEIVAVFRQKSIEFFDIQEYCDYDYMEELEMAESYLSEYQQ